MARLARLLGIAVVVMNCPAFGQVSLTPEGKPFLTSDQLTAVVETEAAAAAIVSQALAYFVRGFPNKTTTLVASQIPESWIPVVPGVKFIRLTDDAARAHLQQCGRLLFVDSFGPLGGDAVAIAIAEGGQCATSGVALRFRRLSDGWHQDTEGPQGGFGSRMSHCPCF